MWTYFDNYNYIGQTHVFLFMFVSKFCTMRGINFFMKFHQSFFLFLKNSLKTSLKYMRVLRKWDCVFTKKSNTTLCSYTFPLPLNYLSDVVLNSMILQKTYFSVYVKCGPVKWSVFLRNNKKVKMEPLFKKVVWWSV